MNALPAENPEPVSNHTAMQFEYDMLNDVYQEWLERSTKQLSLKDAFERARTAEHPGELLDSVQGYLILLAQDNETDSPVAAYRRAQAATVNLVSEIPEDIVEDDLFDLLMDRATSAITNPPVAATETVEPTTDEIAEPSEHVEPHKVTQSSSLPLSAKIEINEETTAAKETPKKPWIQPPPPIPEDFSFEDIVWRKSSDGYAARAKDEQRLDVVRLLLTEGRPLTLIHNVYAGKIPVDYEFDGGVMVEFLPHWEDYYRMELLELKLPESKDMLQQDLKAARLGRKALERYAARHNRAYAAEATV